MIKLNNKGFAITTVLYGTLVLSMLLLVSLLGILSQHKNNLEKLINNVNGARDIVNSRYTIDKDVDDSNVDDGSSESDDTSIEMDTNN